ncbi:MAG: CDP-diacylglycerol--glycerol-3-phosphate 3-phosphatidyltransferase [Bradymonadales bacterium]
MNSKLKEDLLNLPNMLTLARIVLIPLVIIFLSYRTAKSTCIAAIFFAVAAATDFFDGYLARKLNLVSLTGKFLDPLADKLMVMAACVQLAAMGWLEAWVPIVLLTREFAVQGLRQIASAEGMVIAAGQGGKLKTAFQLVGLIGLLIHYQYEVDFFFFSSSVNFHLVGWWMLIASIFFSLISAGQYFAGFLGAITQSGSK